MDSRILAALKHMEQNISEPIDLDTIAAGVKLSKFYFERLFEAEVGESTMPISSSGGEGRARFLGRIYDDPRVTPPDQMRYDCCCVFADGRDARLQLDEVRNNLVTTNAGLYAVADNTRNSRPRPEIYACMLDKWMPKTNYKYSDVPSLEFFTASPVEANSTWAPICTMPVPLE